MQRPLGKFETAATITNQNFPWNLVGILRLDGLPSPEAMRLAWGILQVKHPFLRVRLVEEGGEFIFESGNIPEIPIHIVSREGYDHGFRIAEYELNHRLDTSRGPLLRCMCLSDGDTRGEIIITFHHAVVDGTSVGSIFNELMNLCVRIEAGEEIDPPESLTPLPPVEQRFPPDFQGFNLKWRTLTYLLRQMGDELKFRWGTRGKRVAPINENARGRILHLRISEAITSNLVRRARKERVTLNSALNAAMLLAVEKYLYNGEDTLLRYMSMSDLRPYLKPPAPRDEMGLYISMLRFTTHMFAGRDFWDLARQISAQIYAASKGGEKYIASVMSKGLMRMVFRLRNFRMSTTAISYTGPTPIAPAYGPYKVLGLHGFISNFGLGPEYTAQVSLFDDELWWDILYLDTDMDRQLAQKIADDIREILIDAAG